MRQPLNRPEIVLKSLHMALKRAIRPRVFFEGST